MMCTDLEIDRDTSIRQLLDANQDEVINTLIALNSNFAKLKNPVLRKLLAKRVSIADACKIAGCNVSDFFKAMQAIGFKLKGENKEQQKSHKSAFALPAEDQIHSFDVRPLLAENKDPLREILARVGQLREGEVLKLINSFEPVPLIHLLEKKGFRSYTEHQEEKLVVTWFAPPGDEAQSSDGDTDDRFSGFEEVLAMRGGKVKVIDVSAMEMPRPMHTILEELARLPLEEALFVHHKKVPVYLLPHLHDQGFDYLIREDGPSKISLLIYRP